jgi:hypothetical protein
MKPRKLWKKDKEINEIKKAVQDMDEEPDKDTESLKSNNKNQTEALETKSSISQIKSTVESHSCRF